MTKDDEARTRRRARFRCEDCQLPQAAATLRHQLDHVIARQHGGGEDLSNLALSCVHCNRHKGPNVAGIDPATGGLSRLFHPRRDKWREHFVWRGAILHGVTAVGKTTAQVLAANDPGTVAVRLALIAEGRFRPR